MGGYPNRVPPIKLIFDIDYYNLIIQLLINNEKVSDENIKSKSISLKEKLLIYSVPKKIANDKIEIDIRLYNNESSQLIYQLMYYLKNYINVENNYFDALTTIRENKFKK